MNHMTHQYQQQRQAEEQEGGGGGEWEEAEAEQGNVEPGKVESFSSGFFSHMQRQLEMQVHSGVKGLTLHANRRTLICRMPHAACGMWYVLQAHLDFLVNCNVTQAAAVWVPQP